MAEERKYDWGEEFKYLEGALSNCFANALKTFCAKRPWLLQFVASVPNGVSYNDLYDLYLLNIQVYLGKKSRPELEPICKYGEWGAMLDEEGLQKIVEARGLKNKQEESELRHLAMKRARLLFGCLYGRRTKGENIYLNSRGSKAFWMNKNLNDFFQIISESMEEENRKYLVISQIPVEFIQKYKLEKNSDKLETKRSLTTIINKELLAEFEKDLRDVQKNVIAYWKSSKHWWEKEWLVIPATVGGLLSLISAIVAVMVAIVRWLMQFDWLKLLFE